MHSKQAQDKIFKTWSGISEVSIIKEVATKGVHIELCIEYWAQKRKIPPNDYRHYFYDVVQAYVQRLLSERLVCKAETVLRNVERDVKCVFFQYACECGDADLSEIVLDHLRSKEPQLYEQEQSVLHYYWSLVQQLRECGDLLDKYKVQLPRVHIEALMMLPEETLQRLLVELYFTNGNDTLLTELKKDIVWQHLVDSQDIDKLRRWCLCHDTQESRCESAAIEQAYMSWEIEPAMYEYALTKLNEPCEPLRNYFARAGYFFPDEAADIPVVLRRLCTMQCLAQHEELLSKLPLANYVLERGYYPLLLMSCVPVSSVQQLMGTNKGTNDALLLLIIDLKSHSLTHKEDFETLSRSVKTYLECTHSGEVPIEEDPLVTFFDFLCQQPSVAALEGFLSSTNLSRVPYLNSLKARFDHGPTSTANAVPTPHELFLKFKNVNFASLYAATHGDIASFSNPRLCQRYAGKSNLNYMHYLKQQRSAYAVYHFFMEQLQLYGQITKAQLFHACEMVTDLALQQAGDEELVVHCVAFCEMLGFDTQYLRGFLFLQRNLTVATEPCNYSELIQRWDTALVQQLKASPKQFPFKGYQALMRLAARQGTWPSALLRHYAAENDWWHLLLVLQYFEVPVSELKKHLEHFKYRTVGMHLLRALSHDASNERPHKRTLNRQPRRTDGPTNSSQENMSNLSHSSILDANSLHMQSGAREFKCNLLTHSTKPDLFALLICSSNNLPDEIITHTGRFLEVMQSNGNHCTGLNLLKHCVKQEMPVLAVLAATASSRNVDWCWLVWLAVATGQWQSLQQEASKATSELEYVWFLIRGAVSGGHVNALLHSFVIFQQDCKFVHLCRFLQLTAKHEDFSSPTILELRQFFCCCSMNDMSLPLCPVLPRKILMQRCVGLLLTQLQTNFDSFVVQEKYLDCICRSDVGDICDLVDFCLLHKAFTLAASWMCQLSINFELLLRRDSPEYKRLVDALTEANEYSKAVELASLLQLPICDIISSKWVAEYDADMLHPYAHYEHEIEEHALPPSILVSFFLHAAALETSASLRKYELIYRTLSVIKKHHLFPNESFDRDQIEYDLVLCYLELPADQVDDTLSIYHSEYFEQIMMQERCVLYKSFMELKELAGIEDLSPACKSTLTPQMENRLVQLLDLLLDKGDIVEALRLQELFEFRPNDLRFIAFMMALAEGVTTIFNLSSKERQLLTDTDKRTFPKFNRLTLNEAQSPLAKSVGELSDSCSTLEFEEIPSKEKQETLSTLMGIASKLKHGVELGKRIVMAFRAAMYLDKEYLDVLRTKDVGVLLKSAGEEECLQRLLVVSDIHTSTRLTPKEIADLMALELTTCIIRPRFYILNANQPRNAPKNAFLWGHSIDRDFHLFLELAPNTTMLGNSLLEYCNALTAFRRYQERKAYDDTEAFQRLSEIIAEYGLPKASPLASAGNVTAGNVQVPQVMSHKKHNQIYIELLIKAHHCFVHECSMEGIASVLQRTKSLNSVLTKAKSWALIVRMLIGIGRYREMYYCFDALIDNEQFESLLGQFDEDQKCGLRLAIISYLREHNPKNSKELLRLAALHFMMYKELADMWSQEGKDILSKVCSLAELITDAGKGQIKNLKCSTEVQALLQQALENYTHATENYLLDNKLLLAQNCVSMAQLVAMQIDLCNKSLESRSNKSVRLCLSVISVQTREEFRELANTELFVPQTLILSRACGYDVNWSEAILSQFIMLENADYLKQFQYHQRINDNLIEQVIKGYVLHSQSNAIKSKHDESLSQLVELVRSVTLKYKLASILGLKPIIMSLLNGSAVHYLRDTNFGKNQSHHAGDM